MNQETDKKPVSSDVPENDSGQDDPIESLLSNAVANWKEVVAGLILAAVVVVAVSIYRHKSAANRERAFTQLAVASSTSQLNEIQSQFPGSKAAELASFMVARTQFDAGLYPEADQAYADFLKKYPTHFMAPAAQLGRIHCREASGQPEAALPEYRQFTAANPSHTALGLVARLGEARCLRQINQQRDAIAIYENLLLEFPESDWKPLIEDLKSATVRDLERVSRLMPLTPAAPAS